MSARCGGPSYGCKEFYDKDDDDNQNEPAQHFIARSAARISATMITSAKSPAAKPTSSTTFVVDGNTVRKKCIWRVGLQIVHASARANVGDADDFLGTQAVSVVSIHAVSHI